MSIQKVLCIDKSQIYQYRRNKQLQKLQHHLLLFIYGRQGIIVDMEQVVLRECLTLLVKAGVATLGTNFAFICQMTAWRKGSSAVNV